MITCLPLVIVSASLLIGCGDSDAASTRPQDAFGTMQKDPATGAGAISGFDGCCESGPDLGRARLERYRPGLRRARMTQCVTQPFPNSKRASTRWWRA